MACCATAFGCATSLSTFQPAHVAAKGSFSAEAGLDLSAPLGTIGKTIDGAKTLASAARSRELTPAEKQQLFDAGANLALNPPLFVEHVGITYSPFEHWELGVRYAAQAWRLGLRRQLMRQEVHGVDLTIGAGVQHFSFDLPIGDIIDVLEVDEYVRWNIDVPILFGTHSDYYRLWGGPRLVMSQFSTRIALHLPATQNMAAMTEQATVDGWGTYVGAQGGVAIGYRHLFVGVELTVVRMISAAHLTALGNARDVDLGGWVIYPGLALMGEL